MFHFTCFNVEDPHDPSVGLINGQLSIPGALLRREVCVIFPRLGDMPSLTFYPYVVHRFDPVVQEVCACCNDARYNPCVTTTVFAHARV